MMAVAAAWPARRGDWRRDVPNVFRLLPCASARIIPIINAFSTSAFCPHVLAPCIAKRHRNMPASTRRDAFELAAIAARRSRALATGIKSRKYLQQYVAPAVPRDSVDWLRLEEFSRHPACRQ